ncbi:hypothetical protein SPI_03194 [Niveomyces insectorum RCEF 264]|uniref:Uncharacterized protein n=1 Tax=Niveomyces insectorum RCEF 264 TaxID=1081102 RepID=A0A167X5B7_9HYPO|nr:hypothetical protein SPI_03194 [Niveomyces insectorum RCEF 264]
MGFGDGVNALLETYAKCLALLRVFGAAPTPAASGAAAGASPASAAASQTSVLSRSLQADRAKVQQVYLTRLSETGSRLEKGDERSRSALRRIVRRLTDALVRLVSFGSERRSSNSNGSNGSGEDRPLLNYEALRALSNASRNDAIEAIDALSVRLNSRSSRSGQSSRSSLAGRAGSHHDAARHSASSSTSLVPREGRRRQNGHRHRRPTGFSDSSKERTNKKTDATKTGTTGSKDGNTTRPRPPSKRLPPTPSRHAERAAVQKDTRAPDGSRRLANNNNNNNRERASGRSGSNKLDQHAFASSRPPAVLHSQKRVSLASSSSASTKLGEIPERKLRKRTDALDYWDERGDLQGYNVRPLYPLRPHQMPEDQKRKKGFLGMFRGRS